MHDFFVSMTYPFLACLALAGIHVYLGIHVIERKVIFVDLALAQLAALGSVYAVLLGYTAQTDPWATKAFSLAFAVAGAAVFALTRARRERVPQEAVIGIAYAASLAASILAGAHLPHGADELRELLAGNILWVTRDTVVTAAAVYAAVGLFHYCFRERLLAVSIDATAAHARGVNVRLWDFLFYVSFAVVVTSSVTIAGVLLVFAFLVVPAVIAVLLTQNIRSRLLLGWTVGATISFAGVAASYAADLPSGPVIVLALVAALVAVTALRAIAAATDRRAALARAVAVAAVLAVAVWGSTALRKETAASDSASATGAELDAPAGGLDRLPDLHALLRDRDSGVREAAVRAIHALASPESRAPLAAAAVIETDDYLRTEMAESLIELGDARGIPLLVGVVDEGSTRQVRKEAYEHLSHHIAVELPPADAKHGNLMSWWLEIEPDLRWNADRLVYELPPD